MSKWETKMNPKGSQSRVWQRCASGVAELEASADERGRTAEALPDLGLKDMDGLGLVVSRNLAAYSGDVVHRFRPCRPPT